MPYTDPAIVAELSRAEITLSVAGPSAAEDLAEDLAVRTVNQAEAGAALLAGRLVSLGDVGVDLWELKLAPGTDTRTLGEVVLLDLAIWAEPRRFLVIGVKQSLVGGDQSLTLMGGVA